MNDLCSLGESHDFLETRVGGSIWPSGTQLLYCRRCGQTRLLAPHQARFARAFTEWDRRYREEPERFTSEAEHLLKQTPETYGEACAPYFLNILQEVEIGTSDAVSHTQRPTSYERPAPAG